MTQVINIWSHWVSAKLLDSIKHFVTGLIRQDEDTHMVCYNCHYCKKYRNIWIWLHSKWLQYCMWGNYTGLLHSKNKMRMWVCAYVCKWLWMSILYICITWAKIVQTSCDVVCGGDGGRGNSSVTLSYYSFISLLSWSGFRLPQEKDVYKYSFSRMKIS